MGSKFIFVLIPTLIVISEAYPYNDRVFPSRRYTDTCCQLEWKNITKGDHLPTDYVVAGSFMDRNWAYVLNYNVIRSTVNLALKSDQASEDINSLGYIQEPAPYPVLTNPNHCHIDWYTSRFHGEELPRNNDWYFPVINSSPGGNFARTLDGKPGYFNPRFGIEYPSSLTKSVSDKPSKYQLMYVDCKKSILTMSQAKLFNITYDENAYKHLKSVPNRVLYNKITKINNSPEPMKSGFKFSVETFDNASLKLSKSHADFFYSTEDTYKVWETKADVNFLYKFLGIGVSGGIKNEKWTSTGTGSTNNQNVEIYSTTARREKFKFSQEITVPPFSKTTVIAFSKPVQGNIPFTAIYELFPTGSKESNTAKVLEATLKKYGMDQKMEKTNRGTLLVHYEGFMHVDVGHEVDVDVQTTKLDSYPQCESSDQNNIKVCTSNDCNRIDQLPHLYLQNNLTGNAYILQIPSDAAKQYCINLAADINDRANSIDTRGQCVRFYENANCGGKSLGLSGSTGRDDLSKEGFDKQISSFGNCFDSDKKCVGLRSKRQAMQRCRFFDETNPVDMIPGLPITHPPLISPWHLKVDLQIGLKGRIEYFSARIQRSDLGTGTRTTSDIRKYAHLLGKYGDDAGHILASRLGGPGHEKWNIFPQSPNFNRGVWRSAEAMMAEVVDKHASGTLTVRFTYENALTTRPISFAFKFERGIGYSAVAVLLDDFLNP